MGSYREVMRGQEEGVGSNRSVARGSWLLFNVLELEGPFLHKATIDWEEDKEFIKFSCYVRNLKVSNGVAPFFLVSLW